MAIFGAQEMAHVLLIATKQGKQRAIDANQQQRQLAGLALRTQTALLVPAADGTAMDAYDVGQLLLRQPQLLTGIDQGFSQYRIGIGLRASHSTHHILLRSFTTK